MRGFDSLIFLMFQMMQQIKQLIKFSYERFEQNDFYFKG